MLELLKSPYLDRQLAIDTNVASGTLEPIIWTYREVQSNPNGNKAYANISVFNPAFLSEGYTLQINDEIITFGSLADISVPQNLTVINLVYEILNNNPQITGRYELLLEDGFITIQAKRFGSKYNITLSQDSTLTPATAFGLSKADAVDVILAQTYDDYAVILEVYTGEFGFLNTNPSLYKKTTVLRLVNDGNNYYEFDIADILNQQLINTPPEYQVIQKFTDTLTQSTEYTIRAAEFYDGSIQGKFIIYSTDCRFWAVKARHTIEAALFYFNWRRSIAPDQPTIYALTNRVRKYCHWKSLQWIYFAYNNLSGEASFDISITLFFENGAIQTISDPTFIQPTFDKSGILYVEVSTRCFDFQTLETSNSSELKSYTVSILNDFLVPITYPITYVVDNCNRCQDDVLNIVYENTYGGFDTLTPLNFEEKTISVNRVTTDRNNVFYTQEETEIKVDTGFIASEFAESFREFLNSKEIYLISERYDRVKCVLKAGDYNILRNGDMNKMEFTLVIFGESKNG